MSLVAALLVLPVNNALGEPEHVRKRIEATCLKMNLILTALAGMAVYRAPDRGACAANARPASGSVRRRR